MNELLKALCDNFYERPQATQLTAGVKQFHQELIKNRRKQRENRDCKLLTAKARLWTEKQPEEHSLLRTVSLFYEHLSAKVPFIHLLHLLLIPEILPGLAVICVPAHISSNCPSRYRLHT